MSFFRINEIYISDEKDTYFTYQGLDEIEVKLNRGFTMAKDLLDNLASASDEVRMYMIYQNEQLAYVLKDLNISASPRYGQNAIAVSPGCHAESLPLSFHLPVFPESTTLVGSASPLVLKDRGENLLDNLIHRFPQEDFMIEVKVKRMQDEVDKQMDNLVNKIESLSREAEKNVSVEGHLGQKFIKNLGGGENISYHQEDITAKQLHDIYVNHFYTLKAQSQLFVKVEFVIHGRTKDLLLAIESYMKWFSGRSGSMNVHHLQRDDQLSEKFLALSGSHLIASLIALPTSGVPGVRVLPAVEFGAEVTTPSAASLGASRKTRVARLKLGELYKHHQTRIPVEMSLCDLTKHTLVAGVTGSGKTSTIKQMLLEVHQRQIPFLVIEPAKTEYRFLQKRIPALETYLLGAPGKDAFQFNPFSFPQGIHIQTHLDHLKAVFTAAFPMYGPMPYILETAFYDIYKRTGWDFVSSHNRYADKLEYADLFPTLEDLLGAVDRATEAVGYSDDVSNDVKGALKVRIGSMLSGSKGTMLNTRASSPIGTILQQPTIMELEFMGDDHEKVFLMGLLLMAIYEHYIAQGTHSLDLQHLIVIEEAHRLLTNVEASNNAEVADMKGNAVETFNNILSEIRTYGQGIVVADQIPTKLSPDVIKNTNLKILHRLFAKDDRETVGHAMGLEDQQIKDLIHVKQGYAVLFHGKLDEPLKIRIQVDDAVLAQHQVKSRELVQGQPRGNGQKSQDASTVRGAGKQEAVRFLSADRTFQQRTDRLMNTYLLWPELHEGIARQIVAIGEQLSQGASVDSQSTVILACTIYFTHHHLAVSMSYPAALTAQQSLQSADDPLSQLGQLVETLTTQSGQGHSLQSYSSLYEPYRRLRQILNLQETTISELSSELGESFRMSNVEVIDTVVAHADVTPHLELGFLGPTARRSLAYAVVLFGLGRQMPILETFFEITPALVTPGKNLLLRTAYQMRGGADVSEGERLKEAPERHEGHERELLGRMDQLTTAVEELTRAQLSTAADRASFESITPMDGDSNAKMVHEGQRQDSRHVQGVSLAFALSTFVVSVVVLVVVLSR